MGPPPRPRRQPASSTPAAAREVGRGEVHAPPMAPSPPPGAPSADPAAGTTINRLSDDNMVEILLRLPSSASLARAGAVCRRWANPGFRESFRKLHPSSALIGMYSCDDRSHVVSRTPSFHRVGVPDLDIAAVIRGGKDMLLTRLDDGQRWHMRDCRNGVLLLRWDDGNSLCVYNPVFGGQPVRIQPCPDNVTVEGEGEFVEHCLLQGTVKQCVAIDSFRVVSVQMQQRDRHRMVRAVVYDSGTSEWHCHKWTSLPSDGGSLSIHPRWGTPMYAAGHIFWVYGSTFVYVLDTRNMEFSARPFPSKWKLPDHGYSIGEIEDGKGYLVCLRGLLGENQIPRLQVWSLDASDNLLKLHIKKQIPMSELSTATSRVCSLINGLAVMTYRNGPHSVVDLHKETLLAEFKFSGRAYLYQLSWQPAIYLGSTPPLQDNNIACSQIQYVDPPDVNEGSSNEVAPCENHHTLKSPDTPQDDGPREIRKKRKLNATRNGCLGETIMGHQDQHMPALSSCDPLVVESETVSTTAVSQNNRRVPSRNSLVGQQATLHDKPLKQDILNFHVKKRRASSMRTFTYRFEGCPEEFPAKHEKDIHEKSSVHVKKPFACHTCRKSYDSNRKLNRHLPTHVRHFPCKSCRKEFTAADGLKRHVESIHNLKETPLVCGFKGCGEVFFVKHAKRIHEKSSAHVMLDTLGAERIKCTFEGCQATCSAKRNHNDHYKRKHM